MKNRLRHSNRREETNRRRPGPVTRFLARALVAGTAISAVSMTGPVVKDAMAQDKKQELEQKEKDLKKKIYAAEFKMLQELTAGRGHVLPVDSKLIVDLLDSLVDLAQAMGECADGSKAIPVSGDTNKGKLRSLNNWLNRGGDEDLDTDALHFLRLNLEEASKCSSAKEADKGVIDEEGATSPPPSQEATPPESALPPSPPEQLPSPAVSPAQGETEGPAQEEGTLTDVDSTGFFYRSYRHSPIRPLLPSGGYLHSQGMAENTYALVNKRAVSMFDLDVSMVGLSIPGYSTADGYVYAKGGLRYSALRAQVRGQYNDGTNPPVDWPVTTASFFNEAEGGTTTGYFEFHFLSLFGDSPESVGMDLREGKNLRTHITEESRYVYGLDLAYNFGVAYSTMMGLAVPYPTVGGPPGEGRIEEKSEYSFPMGFELSLPWIAGKVPLVWFEGAGYNFNPTGELHNVYIALTGNFSNHVRLGFVPRYQDTLGAHSFIGEVHLDYRPIRKVTLTAGVLPGYTNMDGDVTRMFGGYGEVEVGTGVRPFSNVASVRAGYVSEFGGEEANRILPSAFVQLRLSGSLPSLL